MKKWIFWQAVVAVCITVVLVLNTAQRLFVHTAMPTIAPCPCAITGKCTCNGTCVCADCRCRECPVQGDCGNCPATDCPIRKPVPSGWQLAKTAEAAEFIDGPLAATVGELCIFRLNDTTTKADWAIIPAAPLYVDSGKNSVCFSTNVAARYTLIAAIVEDGIPKILLHVCDYGGVAPNPTPGPSPTPQPIPANLTDWVRQHRPEVGDTALSAVASCYRAAAEGIQKGLFASQEAAFAALRTATQTKIKIELWSGFFDQLEPRILTKLAGSTDVKKLGEVFTEIAAGLAGSPSETEELLFDTSPIPKAVSVKPAPKVATAADCTTGNCPVPTTTYYFYCIEIAFGFVKYGTYLDIRGSNQRFFIACFVRFNH